MISTSKKADPIADLVGENMKKLSAARAPQIQPAKVKTVAENAGHKVLVVDLGTPTTDFASSVKIDVEGYAVTVAKAGSDRIAVAMELVGAGIYGPIYPGITISPLTRFKTIICRRWGNATSPGAGLWTSAGAFQLGRYLTLVVAKTPEARWQEASNDNSGFFTYRLGAQTSNVATNAPGSVNEGINARGARSIRCGVSTQGISGGNFTAGTIRWWYSADGGSLWGPTGFEQPLPLTPASSLIWLPEFECPFQHGRYFAEAQGVTDSAAGGTVNVYHASYGEGGELNAGEVRP